MILDSTPWYQLAFGEDYLARYSHRDEKEASAAVELILKHVPIGSRSRVFDLCCGPGRHLEQLAARISAELYGGDLSPALLAFAQANDSRSQLVRLDMRHLPWSDRAFDLVTNFFTAFGYFEEDEENFAVFSEVARVLKPGGKFFFDFMNVEPVTRSLQTRGAGETRDTDGEFARVVTRSISPDGRRIMKHETVFKGGEKLREIHESVRLFTQADLERELRRLGFEIDRKFGDYNGAPFAPEQSPRLILIAGRP